MEEEKVQSDNLFVRTQSLEYQRQKHKKSKTFVDSKVEIENVLEISPFTTNASKP